MARTIDSDVGYVRMFAPEAVVDDRARKAVARVTLLCCIVSVLVVAKSIWHVSGVPNDSDDNDSAQYVAIAVSCMLSLMIPACGYFGARDKNRNLLGGFLACNACCVVTMLFDVVLMFLGWAKYRGADCEGFSQTTARNNCLSYKSANATEYFCYATVLMVMAAVYTVAAYWAWGLKQMPYFVQMEAPGVEFSDGGVEMQRYGVGVPTWAQPATGNTAATVPVVVGMSISPNDQSASIPTASIATHDVEVAVVST